MNLEAVLNGKRTKTDRRGDGGNKDASASIRLEVILLKPTSDQETNAVSYPQLLRKETGFSLAEEASKEAAGPLEEEGEGDKLASIARELEKKYGPQKEQDLVDIGEGYDSNDPFVDDSELYEDYVPPTVDTMFGGFYVNTGELEFKKTTEQLGTPLKAKASKPKVKKQSSLTSTTPQALLAIKKVKRAKQIASSAQRTSSLKKKISTYQTSPRPLLAEFDRDYSPMEISEHQLLSSSTAEELKCTDSESAGKKEVMIAPVLPTDLSPSLTDRINKLEESIAKDQATNGKLSYRAKTGYDAILVEIDADCKGLMLKTRMAIFEYLAYKLGINRSSLTNRIKRIIKRKESGNIDIPLQKLKEAVNAAMPPLIQKYEADMELYEAERKLLGSTSSPSVIDNSVDNEDSALCVTDDVFEATPIPTAAVTASGTKRQRKPSKRFQWTDEIRLLLNEVVQAKVDMELQNRTKGQTGEEIINKFIEGHVKTIWPKGWAQKKTLYKMTEPVHSKLTKGEEGQVKKPVTVKKEKQPVTVKKEPGTETGHLPLDPSSSSSPGSTSSKLVSTYSSGANSPSPVGTSPSPRVGSSSAPVTLSKHSPTTTANAMALINLQSKLREHIQAGSSPSTTPTTSSNRQQSPLAKVNISSTSPAGSSSSTGAVQMTLKTIKQETTPKQGVITGGKSATPPASSVLETGPISKGPTRVNKQLKFAPTVLQNIPRDALEAILSALNQQTTGAVTTAAVSRQSSSSGIPLSISRAAVLASSSSKLLVACTGGVTLPTQTIKQSITSPSPLPKSGGVAPSKAGVATPKVGVATPKVGVAGLTGLSSSVSHVSPVQRGVPVPVLPAAVQMRHDMASFAPAMIGNQSIPTSSVHGFAVPPVSMTTLPHALSDHPYVLETRPHSQAAPPPLQSASIWGVSLAGGVQAPAVMMTSPQHQPLQQPQHQFPYPDNSNSPLKKR